MRRFRPNVLVETAEERGLPEDASFRVLCLLALATSCVHDRRIVIDAPPPSPSTDLADDDSPESRIQTRLASLLRHPWAEWRTGTTVVRGFVPHGRGAGIADYLQPEMTYEIVESGKRMERRQDVDGKVVTQSFAMHPEEGLPTPFSGAPGSAVSLEVDGRTVPSMLRTIEGPTHGDAPPTVTKQWTLARDERVLLRREIGSVAGSWVLRGVDRPKTIDGREFLCVEIQQRVGGSGDYTITTTFLSPEVPGHVVEEIKEYYAVPNDGTPRMVTVERTLRFTR